MKRLLLFSNSTNHGQGFLDHAVGAIDSFLGPVRTLAFVPFALHDHAAYTEQVRARLAPLGIEVEGCTLDPAGADLLERAEALFVGGGNTFRLLRSLQVTSRLARVARRVRDGVPYLGASAGINVAGPTIRTTNDMPIVQPQSFEALGLVTYQLNPHYLDAEPQSRHMGESRDERLREFLEENPTPVVGLREGAWLRVEGDQSTLEGPTGGKLFRRGADPVELAPGTVIEPLLA